MTDSTTIEKLSIIRYILRQPNTSAKEINNDQFWKTMSKSIETTRTYHALKTLFFRVITKDIENNMHGLSEADKRKINLLTRNRTSEIRPNLDHAFPKDTFTDKISSSNKPLNLSKVAKASLREKRAKEIEEMLYLSSSEEDELPNAQLNNESQTSTNANDRDPIFSIDELLEVFGTSVLPFEPAFDPKFKVLANKPKSIDRLLETIACKIDKQVSNQAEIEGTHMEVDDENLQEVTDKTSSFIVNVTPHLLASQNDHNVVVPETEVRQVSNNINTSIITVTPHLVTNETSRSVITPQIETVNTKITENNITNQEPIVNSALLVPVPDQTYSELYPQSFVNVINKEMEKNSSLEDQYSLGYNTNSYIPSDPLEYVKHILGNRYELFQNNANTDSVQQMGPIEKSNTLLKSQNIGNSTAVLVEKSIEYTIDVDETPPQWHNRVTNVPKGNVTSEPFTKAQEQNVLKPLQIIRKPIVKEKSRKQFSHPALSDNNSADKQQELQTSGKPSKGKKKFRKLVSSSPKTGSSDFNARPYADNIEVEVNEKLTDNKQFTIEEDRSIIELMLQNERYKTMKTTSCFWTKFAREWNSQTVPKRNERSNQALNCRYMNYLLLNLEKFDLDMKLIKFMKMYST